jgi:hypothetical protein
MPFNFFKKNEIQSSQPSPLYLDRADNLTEFRELEPNKRHGFSWAGIHPKTPYALHFVHVETRFEKRFSDVTHQYYVGVKRGGVTVPLYGRQAKMDAPGLSSDAIAQIVGSEMVKYLLLCRNPRDVPGLLLQIKEGQQCPWSKVFQDARNNAILKQLKKYHVSVEAYLLNPDVYNAIKDEPPFAEEE